jgi:dipeptidyl aminopeptidase/acylaminoacyl peptidase
MKEKTLLLALLFSISLLAASCGADPTISEETAPDPAAPADSADSLPTEPGPAACEEMIFAYSFHSRSGAGSNIIAICPDGSDPRQVTRDGQNMSPSWSPDRSQIAYLSYRSGSLQLHIVNKDGSNDRQLTSDSYFNAWRAIWLPDGNRIAMVNNEGQWQTVNVLTGEITPLDEWKFSGDGVSLSHDGTRVAYTVRADPYDPDSPTEIYIQDIDGSNPYQLTSTGWVIYSPTWSPDDSQIAFLSSSEYGSGQNAIYTINLDGSNLHEPILTNLHPYSIAWSPDGESLAVIAGEMVPTGELNTPELMLQTLYVLNIKFGETKELFKALAPDDITNLSW